MLFRSRSRRIIGFSFVVLAIQIFVQMLFDFRSNNPSLASTINLTAYYLIAILSTASYISLIDNHYLTRNRVQRFIVRYSLFLFFLWVSYFMIPNPYRQAFIWIAALFFFLEVCHLAWQFFNTYQDVVRKVENYYYDNVDVFVRWLYPQNPLKEKEQLLDDQLRLKMVEMAISDCSHFKVNTIEFDLPKPSYVHACDQ